jgi:glycosyltransferase involved in cell wall biosynthesis
VTADRDALDTAAYRDVMIDGWNTVGKAQVYYASPENQSFRGLSRLLRDTPHDVLYLNSFFNSVFSVRPLLARFLGQVPRRPTVIAPRGEFSTGALAIKAWKKMPYLRLATAAGIYRDLTWQASSEHEAADIHRELGPLAGRVVVAPNVPSRVLPGGPGEAPAESGSRLRVAFLSRITPKKNVDFALKVLAQVSAPVEFDLYGPVRDDPYWRRCQVLIAGMPDNVNVAYHGSVSPNGVPAIFGTHDLFFFPTRGENYGHVIAEALTAGTPVLIADTTPWRDLESAGVGWDLPLDTPAAFVDKVEECANMGHQERVEWRSRIQDWAEKRLSDPAAIEVRDKALWPAFLGSYPDVAADDEWIASYRRPVNAETMPVRQPRSGISKASELAYRRDLGRHARIPVP